MKNQVCIVLTLTAIHFFLASTLAMLLPGSRGLIPAIAQSQKFLANEGSQETEYECDDPELVDCGQV